MFLPTTPATTLALFCKVVDNYGDIGICWRLARQLRHEFGIAVTLWVDDLHSFQRICPDVLVDRSTQDIDDVRIVHWQQQEGIFCVEEVADIVIEFFGCDIPPAYLIAMAACDPRPVWINLEGLSAEEWVEGCHQLPSPHGQLSLTKHFFFPGFTGKTGGLLREAALGDARRQFQSDPEAMRAFLAQYGVSENEAAAFKVSLFCYPDAPVTDLFEAWQNAPLAITCLVPEGVACEAVGRFLGTAPSAGATTTRGALSVRVLPFVAQPFYDRLLWACDLNFVRGEDSFVRAQWAGKPFIWHIYPQDKNLHHVKLNAFLKRYQPVTNSLHAFSLAWNGAPPGQGKGQADWRDLWSDLHADDATLRLAASDWEREMLHHGDMASNLLKFAASLRAGIDQ